MRASRHLSGALFLALAAILAWGGSVDPNKTLPRWIVVAALTVWGIRTLRRERTRIDQVYAQTLAIGLAIGAVGWLIPASGSRGLMLVGGTMVVVSAALLLRSLQRDNSASDDADRPG
jgi:hypothetical protein